MTDIGKNKDKVFRVPENYFEDFTADITSRVKNSSNIRSTGLLKLIRPHLMLAASMVAIVLVSFSLLKLLLPSFNRSSQVYDPEDISYILVSEMSETDLFEAIESLDNVKVNEDSLGDISDEEIIDYLVNSGISYEEIVQIQ